MAALLLLGFVWLSSPTRSHDLLRERRFIGAVDPAFLVPEESEVGYYTSNRARYTREDKERLLRLHNDYRSAVTPPAANMRYLEWNEDLALKAQNWIELCKFEHGLLQRDKDPNKALGQNLYHGGDASGEQALFLWFNETHVYDFHSDYCEPGEMCGHYTQMVWADSQQLGCAVNFCPKLGYYVACHYYPPGNVQGQRAYIVGKECSQCLDPINGGLCYKGQCVTKEQCSKYGLTECECNLKCHNCGYLDEEKCRCECSQGWDSLDCSRRCEDQHTLCNKSPGFPRSTCFQAKYFKIPNEYCRAMCDECDVLPEDQPILPFFHPNMTGENDKARPLCCGGVQCPSGYVLNTRVCSCQRLCPGPICDGAISCRVPKISTIIILLFLLFLSQKCIR